MSCSPAANLLRSLLVGYLLVCVACFDPRSQEGLACSGTGGCPAEQECHSGTCYLPGNEPELDAAIDATQLACRLQSLATGQTGATDLDASDASYVYWTGGDGTLVLRSPKSGGLVEVFHDSIPDRHPHDVALDATHVYWSENDEPGRIMRKAKLAPATDPGEELAAGQSQPTKVALDDTHVYWTNLGADSISRVPKVGGAVEVIAVSQAAPSALQVDASYLFWIKSGSGQVMRSGKDGPPEQQLAGGLSQPEGLVLSADRVYWTDAQDDTILSVGKEGGTVQTLASEQGGASSIAVSETTAYWINGAEGALMRMSLSAAPPVLVADGQRGPVSLALDGENIYWLNDQDADNRLVHATCDSL